MAGRSAGRRQSRRTGSGRTTWSTCGRWPAGWKSIRIRSLSSISRRTAFSSGIRRTALGRRRRCSPCWTRWQRPCWAMATRSCNFSWMIWRSSPIWTTTQITSMWRGGSLIRCPRPWIRGSTAWRRKAAGRGWTRCGSLW